MPKKSPIVLIKMFFGLTLQEAKAEKERLTDLDMLQLASAIARQMGLNTEDLSFDLVTY